MEGQVWHDSLGIEEINMNSLEKNITDIDSADLEREFQQDNALMEESLRISNGGGFLTRAAKVGANDPFGIEGGSEIDN